MAGGDKPYPIANGDVRASAREEWRGCATRQFDFAPRISA
jgi:hypothetical protein